MFIEFKQPYTDKIYSIKNYGHGELYVEIKSRITIMYKSTIIYVEDRDSSIMYIKHIPVLINSSILYPNLAHTIDKILNIVKCYDAILSEINDMTVDNINDIADNNNNIDIIEDDIIHKSYKKEIASMECGHALLFHRFGIVEAIYVSGIDLSHLIGQIGDYDAGNLVIALNNKVNQIVNKNIAII